MSTENLPESIAGNRNKGIGKVSLEVGFVIEIHTINEDLESPMAEDSLADFMASALIGSGYGEIWLDPEAFKTFVEDPHEYTEREELWVDPSCIYSYLEALVGEVSGDLFSISFQANQNAIDFDSASWEVIRKKLRMSLSNELTLEELGFSANSSGLSFFLEELDIDGENLLSIEKLETALEGLRDSLENQKSVQDFLEFFAPEWASLNRLPIFLSGHLWAQLLSGCNWELASQILKGDSSISFDSDSFTWQFPAEDLKSYPGGSAVSTHRSARRSLNFAPWPSNAYNHSGYSSFELLAGREPAAQEKISAFAALYLLIDHEDNEEDDAPYTSDKVRDLIEGSLSEPLGGFIEQNTPVLYECYVNLLESMPDGQLEEHLPVWAGSEGVLAGVPDPWGGEETPITIEFASELVESVESLWPDFISIVSEKQV